MSSTGVLVASGPGRGITYPRHASLFTAGVAVTAGDVYALDEAGDINSPNENTTGALAVVRDIVAGDLDVTTKLVTFVLAEETAALNGKFRGVVEDYGASAAYVGGAPALGGSMVPTASGTLDTVVTTVGEPIVAYALSTAATPGVVHFNGTPGGFAADVGA